MCGYFRIEFINYMLKDKTLLDYTNLFSPNDFKKNDQIIKRIFNRFTSWYCRFFFDLNIYNRYGYK